MPRREALTNGGNVSIVKVMVGVGGTLRKFRGVGGTLPKEH